MQQLSEHTIQQLKDYAAPFHILNQEINKVIVGHQDTLSFVLYAILCNGHILLEGLPGVAKTTMIKTLTQALGLSFKRIQFTPDLLPADLVGIPIYNSKTQDFETRKGPIFANLVLADEINRAPAKVQAALLEAMQEHQVTIGSETFKLDQPFLVFATQNPIEQEGTYRLPEAQVDRFMFKLTVNYPNQTEEKEIIKRVFNPAVIQQVMDKETILRAQQSIKSIYVNEKIVDYMVSIVFATREPQQYKLATLSSLIRYGASPRATLALHYASRAHAFLQGRHFVTPDDVKAVCFAVLRHRILLSYEAEATNVTQDYIIQQILNVVPSP